MLKIPSPFLRGQTEEAPHNVNGDSITCVDYTRYTSKGKRRDINAQLNDRRIKVMSLAASQLPPTWGWSRSVAMDPNGTLQLLGQRLVSKVFEQHIGEAYNPSIHWTSNFRELAGFSCMGASFEQSTPFTISDRIASRAVTTFLHRAGYTASAKWYGCAPVYHFDVAPSAGDWRAPFSCDSRRFEMVSTLIFCIF
jgi:hypothetical protein